MRLQEGTIVEVKSELMREISYIGTIVEIWKANDAEEDSKNLNDYVFQIKNNKTGEINNVSGPRILKVIR